MRNQSRGLTVRRSLVPRAKTALRSWLLQVAMQHPLAGIASTKDSAGRCQFDCTVEGRRVIGFASVTCLGLPKPPARQPRSTDSLRRIADGRGDRPGWPVPFKSGVLTEDGPKPSDAVFPAGCRSGHLSPMGDQPRPIALRSVLARSRTGSAVTLRSAVCDQRRRDISRRFITAVNPDLLHHLVRLQSAGR